MPVSSKVIDGVSHVVFDNKNRESTKTGYKTHEQSIKNKLSNDDNFTIQKIPNQMKSKIIELRKKSNLNQAELAKRCNVNVVLIQECESGKANYDPALFSKIAKVLGVSSLKN